MLKSNIKIIDFGCSTYLGESKLKYSALGSPVNMDPIILSKITNKNEIAKFIGYDEKADIWSLGTICYEMLIGHNVFNAKNLGELIDKVENGTYKVPTDLSKEAVSFLNSMLQYDASKRLSAEELSQHQFLKKNIKDFQRINLKQVYNKIDKEGLKINIKKNNSIWSIFNEENEQYLINIPPYLNNLKPIPEYESGIVHFPEKEDNKNYSKGKIKSLKVKNINPQKICKDENNYLQGKELIERDLEIKKQPKKCSPPSKIYYNKYIFSPINNKNHNEIDIISGQMIKYIPLGSRMPQDNLDKYNLKSPRKGKSSKVKDKQKNIIDNYDPILKKDEIKVNLKLKEQQYNEILNKNKIELKENKFNQNWGNEKNMQIKINELEQRRKDSQIKNQKKINNFLQYEKYKKIEFKEYDKTPLYSGQKIFNNIEYNNNNMGIITPKKEKEIISSPFSLTKNHHKIKEEIKNNSPIQKNNNYKMYKSSKSQKNIRKIKQDNYNFDEESSEELDNIIENRFNNELTIKNCRHKNNYLYNPFN